MCTLLYACTVIACLVCILTVNFTTDSSTTPDIIGTSIKVSGLPANISDDDIELYFEIDKSGGKKGSVKKCTVEKCGVAYVDFHSSEGNISMPVL